MSESALLDVRGVTRAYGKVRAVSDLSFSLVPGQVVGFIGAMTDFQGDWYGLGVMDLSGEYGTLAVGHEGASSAPQCCSLIRLLAFPQEGAVISVQVDTPATDDPYGDYNGRLVSLTQALRAAVGG